MDDPVPAEARDLYSLPPEEFTSARNSLAEALRRQGRREEGRLTSRLAKPTRTAWAINQLARSSPKELQWLFQAHEKLARAQEEGDRSELLEATNARRDIIARLGETASNILRESGHPPSAAARQHIIQTLMATATDEQAARLVSEGMLTKGFKPPHSGSRSGRRRGPRPTRIGLRCRRPKPCGRRTRWKARRNGSRLKFISCEPRPRPRRKKQEKLSGSLTKHRPRHARPAERRRGRGDVRK